MKNLSIPALLISFSILLPWGCQATRGAADGAGDGPEREIAGAPASTHLHLVLRISEDGTAAQVVNAAEIPGDAVLSDSYDGPYLWQVSRDGKAIAAGSVPDPFASRGFAPPGSPAESQGRSKSATISAKVPGASLSDPLESLSVRIYRLRPAADGSGVAKVDAETLERLRREGRLESVAELSGKVLAAQIRKVGRQAD